MPMNVAYQEGLEDIARELAQRGFTVQKWGEAGYVDALVYSEPYNRMFYASIPPAASSGMLLVNAFGRTAAEVADMLIRRSYSRIF